MLHFQARGESITLEDKVDDIKGPTLSPKDHGPAAEACGSHGRGENFLCEKIMVRPSTMD